MISAVLAVALAAGPSSGVLAGGQCGVCHPTERVAFEDSVHAREQVGCEDCHGGDPQSIEVDRAHRGRFRSLEDRREIPDLCARCHSDPAMMRPYNLPTEQYVIYQTSEHGMALARGDDQAAVCSDCHGAHDVLSRTDPESRVHSRNIPATCAGCHADAALMGRYGLDPSINEQYRSSVHGMALLDQGNTAAPDCSRCHGVHGATPPGVGDVEKVCGGCHQQVRREFREGPHHEGLTTAGLAECASCHENHAIRTFAVADLESLCAECHAEGSDETVAGSKLRSMIAATRQEIDKAEDLIREAEQIPFDMEDQRARIIQARTYLKELPTLTHGLSLEAVDTLARRARSVGEEVQHDVYSKLRQRATRRVILAALWFYILMTVAILVGYKRRLRRGDAAE
jgi:predicted CXXCH cytochrome family protein